MPALRILHISTRLILGGSQENTVLSCEGQAGLGHDVHLAFGPIFGPEGSLLERAQQFRTSDGRAITLHQIPSLVREINPRKDWACLFALKRLIEEIEPDIVHTHSSKAGILGRAAAWAIHRRNLRTPGSATQVPGGSSRVTPAVIHTIHGPPFHRFLPAHKNTIYAVSERWAAKRCHTIVSVADAMTEQYLARRIGRLEQYITVRSGMETRKFLAPAPGEDRDSMRAELGFAENDFVIGTVARLAELKGHDDLLDALGDELRNRSSWKLLWVGDGWWADRLLGRVKEMGLADQVVQTGLVPQHRVPAMMRAMEVLCHPSYREGLPRTVPQALLCAVPPVANDVDGTREICRDMDTGRLTKPGDIEGLRNAIVWMFEHPEERRAMAERGRDEVAREFSAERMVERLEEVYADALDRARVRTRNQ
ncbi:MAG: glycosyltransferase family 4 protein [Planctomycetota bacterium]